MASPVTAGAAALAFGLIRDRTGSAPIPSEVEDVLRAGSRIESGLTSFFDDGAVVDLAVLADEINTRYPATVTDPPPIDPCP